MHGRKRAPQSRSLFIIINLVPVDDKQLVCRRRALLWQPAVRFAIEARRTVNTLLDILLLCVRALIVRDVATSGGRLHKPLRFVGGAHGSSNRRVCLRRHAQRRRCRHREPHHVPVSLVLQHGVSTEKWRSSRGRGWKRVLFFVGEQGERSIKGKGRSYAMNEG